MIVAGDVGAKRIIELHKTRSSEINTQIEADKAELSKIVGTAYLNKVTTWYSPRADGLIICDNVQAVSGTLKWSITGNCYVEEQIKAIPFTATLSGKGSLYGNLSRGYCTVACQYKFTATDGTQYTYDDVIGYVDMSYTGAHMHFTINRVLNHVRFVSNPFPIQSINPTIYVFK